MRRLLAAVPPAVWVGFVSARDLWAAPSPSPTSSPHGPLPVGGGGSVAALIVFALLVVLIVFYRRRVLEPFTQRYVHRPLEVPDDDEGSRGDGEDPPTA
jgi:hypothetical protein